MRKHNSITENEIELLVMKSKARDNRFLNKHIPMYNLVDNYIDILFKRFFPLTKTFALSGLQYTSNVARKIQESSGSDAEKLETYLCEILSISAGEFRIKEYKRSEIHYNLFFDTFRSILPRIKQPRRTDETTARLIRLIESNFLSENIVYGFANYYVIEKTAPFIVDAIDYYLKPYMDNKGIDSMYLQEHKILEEEHSSHVANLISPFIVHKRDYLDLERTIKNLCIELGSFWEDLSSAISK